MDDKVKRGGHTVYRVFSQDLYVTSMHGDEIGIRQVEQWRSKSRQFTQDADIIGRIAEAELKSGEKHLPSMEKAGFIILRQSVWNNEKDERARRLVVKLFSESGRWLASIEEMVAEECTISYATDEPLLTFAVLVAGKEIVTYIRQLRRGARNRSGLGHQR